jgi:hypothetical protein
MDQFKGRSWGDLDNRHDIIDSQGLYNFIKRANQYRSVKWKPLLAMPLKSSVAGAMFPAGETATGIPYSSVRKACKFIGFDVSLETFMTAVNNPFSVLYTRNLSDPGDPDYMVGNANCATYYGTVCSAYVSLALDLAEKYQTNIWSDMPGATAITDQSAYGVRIGDTILESGHVKLIASITRNGQGRVAIITTYESLPDKKEPIPDVDYTESQFNALLASNGGTYTIYRHSHIPSITYTALTDFVAVDEEALTPYTYNTVLMTDYGNKALYKTGVPVEIVVLDATAISLVLQEYDDGDWNSIATIAYGDIVGSGVYGGIAYPIHSYANGAAGVFRAYCNMPGESISDCVYWTTGSVSVSGPESASLGVNFSVVFSCSSNLSPLFLEWCDITGSAVKVQAFTAEEISAGTALTNYSSAGYYYRVFAGDTYGRIASDMEFTTLS